MSAVQHRDCAAAATTTAQQLSARIRTWQAERRDPSSILIIFDGESRGDALVWTTQFEHLIRPLDADVALFCGADECARYGPLLDVAKHVWVRRHM